MKKIAIFLVACSLLSGCGIKGHLELEQDLNEQVDSTI